jgi:hypothetical protein
LRERELLETVLKRCRLISVNALRLHLRFEAQRTATREVIGF